MKSLIIALLLVGLVGLSNAFLVRPDYFEFQDTGNKNLPTMYVDILIDCDTKELTIEARSEETDEPIEGATVHIFYTDYVYQALPTVGTTDENGITKMEIPGNIRFLTALFILRVDHTDYQSKEIEFAYEKCFEEPPEEEISEEDEAEENETEAPPPPSPETNETEEPEEPEEVEENVTENETQEPEIPTDEEEQPLPCPTALILLSLLIIRSKV